MMELTGLSITNPQAMLASFGLLRIVALNGYPQATLAWRPADHIPCLSGLDWSELMELTERYIGERELAPELNWADTIKGYPRNKYRELCRGAAPELVAWAEAYWHEAEQKDGTKLLESRLDMTAGGLKLFAAVRKLIPHVRSRLEPALREALLGPWLNADNVGSLGWDPCAMKSGATIAGGKAPTSAPHATVSAAMWLAFEALPLFPARWLAELGGPHEIVWVLPHRPATLAHLQQMQLAGPRTAAAELAAEGWSCWSVEIIRNGKFGCLLPPVRV
jgi:hypothetical protein